MGKEIAAGISGAVNKGMAAGISATANVASTYFTNKAAKQKGAASRAAFNYANGVTNSALSRLDPYAKSGEQAMSPLTGLLLGKQYDPTTGDFKDISQEERQNLFQKSPGYQFRLEQAQNALQASQAAKGGLLSGGAMKEMNAYTQGLASDEYGNYISQLGNLAGMGQNAATTQSGIEINTLGALTGLKLGGDRNMINAIQNQNIASGITSFNGDMMSVLGGKSSGAQGANSGGIGGQSFWGSGSNTGGGGSASAFGNYSMPNASLNTGGRY